MKAKRTGIDFPPPVALGASIFPMKIRTGVRALSRTRCSGQSFSVQREQTAPCLLGLWLVVDLRIRRAPAMRGACVHFDFRGQVHLGERLFQNVLLIGRPHVVVCRDRDEELRLGLRGLKMRTVRHIGYESAAME